MQLSFPSTGFLRRLGITEVQAVQPGRCESQAATQSSSCASHTWNRVKTAATYSAPASGLHSQDERWRTRHARCWSLCPSTDESGGGVKVNTKRSHHLKEIQRTDELVSFTFSKLLVLVFLSQWTPSTTYHFRKEKFWTYAETDT